MLEKLRGEAKLHNCKIVMIPVNRLQDLKGELDEFRDTTELNDFQKWILSDIYKFDLPEVGFKINSLILVAAAHPLYTNVILHYQGKQYETKGLLGADMSSTASFVRKVANDEGFQVHEETWSLPFKRLAVQSGLATYGRNNVTYVEDFGSKVSYTAFFCDAVSEEDTWRPMNHAKICDTCNICLSACPTGAIMKDRFLINNERCLSCMNEGVNAFPDWLPKSVHHKLYDCLRCQEKCPMNLKTEDPKEEIQTIEFTEEETKMILEGKKKEDFSEDFIEKAEVLGIFKWQMDLARNIRAIMEAANEA